MGKVPIGRVVAGMTQQGRRLDAGEGQIHPFLIDEHAVGQRHPATIVKLLTPPIDQLQHALAATQREEAQVVGPRPQNLHVVRLTAVVRQEIGQVGRQDDAVALQQVEQLVERLIDDDVRIEINQPLAAEFSQERVDRVRLDGRVQLQAGVFEGEFPPAIDPQLFRRDHLERLGRRLEAAVDPIAQDQAGLHFGVMSLHARQERPHLAQVVLRGDREYAGGGCHASRDQARAALLRARTGDQGAT